jgi:hypothetical protein
VTGSPGVVRVDCTEQADGWICDVQVGTDADATRHRVDVGRDDLAHLAGADERPDRLIEESFAFLLEREPRTSILRVFDLTVIGRYFPDYPEEIVRRLRR